jgi:type II secretory pathway component GspD/PulD (secretin)
VKENEAFAFGGLSGISESEDIKKVPIAGDVPLVGYIFKSKNKTASQTNLIAYITARVRPVGEKSVMPAMTPTTPVTALLPTRP